MCSHQATQQLPPIAVCWLQLSPQGLCAQFPPVHTVHLCLYSQASSEVSKYVDDNTIIIPITKTVHIRRKSTIFQSDNVSKTKELIFDFSKDTMST